MANKKPTSAFKTYFRLLRYLKGLGIPFAVSIMGFVVFAASQPMLAKIMELTITAIEAKDADARFYLPILAVGVFVIRGLGTFLGVYYNHFVGATVIRKIRSEIFDKLLVLPATFFENATQGQLLHRISGGVGAIQSAVTTAVKTVIREGLTVIFLLAWAFYLNWKLSLIFLLVAPVLGVLVRNTGKRFRKITRKSEGALGVAMQVSKETITNFDIVRGFGAEAYERGRYQKALETAFRAQLKIRKVQAAFSPISQLIIAMAMAAIIFLLLEPGILAENTTGELVGYLTAVALIPKPLRQLSSVSVTIQRGVIGGELVFRILDRESENDSGQLELDECHGEVAFRSLSFRYPTSESDVLQDIDFLVRPGEMVALVGKSGSGKTTLSSLIYRMYDVDDGQIFIDGIDINRIKLASLRRQISIVSQKVALFDDSVRNNVGYGVDAYSDEQIMAALEKAHAADFVDALPNKLDSRIGENGSLLSGGQRQRLAIARAFLKNAPILILDEATSSLDNESEAIVTAGIENLTKSRTTIVIAHRLSTILNADKLVVVHEGRIVEMGTHHELIDRDGYYAKLYATEFNA